MNNYILNAKKKAFDFSTLKKQFIEYIEVSENTVNTYMVGLENFSEYISQNNIYAPDRNTIINWKNFLKEKYSCSTINTYIVAVKAFFSFLEMARLYPNISKNIKNIKTSQLPKKNVLTLEQTKLIYKQLSDKREKALWGILITTGLRGVEIANAKIEDIKIINDETCLFVKCKGHQEYDEYVKLSEDVVKDLVDYLDGRTSGNIFISTSNNNKNCGITIKTIRLIIKNIFKDFGLDDETLSLHSTRRTFACISYNLGKSIYDIQSVLHHKSIQTTARYLKQVDRNNNNTEKLVANAVFN